VTTAIHANRVRDPALTVSRELEMAIRNLRAADNPFGRLLAVRNGAKALAMSGHATDDAMDRLRGIAVSMHRLKPSDVAAAINLGGEMSRVARQPPPMPPSAGGGTPSTTVEALMYSLRRGLSCLDDPRNRDRLARCDADAVKEVAARLLDMKARSKDARANWHKDDVVKLIAVWRAIRGQS
jgi:hypothetical protein